MTARPAIGTYVTGRGLVDGDRQGWVAAYSQDGGKYARLQGQVGVYICPADNLTVVVNPPALRCSRCHEPQPGNVPFGPCNKLCGGLVEVING